MGLSKRQCRVLFIVGFVVSAAIVPSASALLALFTSSYDVTGGVTYGAPSGPQVNVTGSATVQSGNPFTDANTVALNTSEGNITFSSPGETNATISASTINGTWTNVTSLNVTGANLTIDPEDKSKIVVGGDADTLKYRDSMAVDDGQRDLIYGGASGTTILELYGLPTNTYVGLRDTATGDILAGGKTTANGVLTVETPNSDHSIELVSTDGAPQFKDKTASPTGDQSSTPETLSVNVTDSDFPDDTVNVTFYLDGTKVATDTLNDAGKASVNISRNLSSGSHDWYAVAEDKFGQSTESPVWSFGVPNELRFYNESAPNQLLDNITVTATIYADDEVYNRTTTDGSINLSDLPAGQELVIVASADGYYSRHIVIDSLAEQNQVYLLPSSNVSTVEVRFKLDDQTGNFPPDETELIIQKPLTINNTTAYRTIAADQFGAGDAGFTVNLEDSIRYRLKIRNPQGDVRTLGPYTASVSETVTLRPAALGVNLSGDKVYDYTATQENISETQDRIVFQFRDEANRTKNLRVTIYQQGNESNNFPEETFDGPLGNVSVSQVLNAEQSNTTWVVEWTASRNGEIISGQVVVGSKHREQLIQAPDWLQQAAAVLFVIMTMALFSRINAGTGAVVTSLVAGGFWYAAWLPAAAGGVIVVCLLIGGIAKATWAGGV